MKRVRVDELLQEAKIENKQPKSDKGLEVSTRTSLLGADCLVVFNSTEYSVANLLWATDHFKRVSVLMFETPKLSSHIFRGEHIAQILGISDVNIMFLAESDVGFLLDSAPHSKYLLLAMAISQLRLGNKNHLVWGIKGFTQEVIDKYFKVIGLSDNVKGYVPYTDISKDTPEDYMEIIKNLSVDNGLELLKYAFACESNESSPCGRCIQCSVRNESFKVLGVKIA